MTSRLQSIASNAYCATGDCVDTLPMAAGCSRIQRATHRDTQALHAKLDELFLAQSEACNRLALIDREDPGDIEKHRRLARAADRKDDEAA